MIFSTVLLLSSCVTRTVVKAEEVDHRETNEFLIDLLPDAPEVPSFPELTWSYDNGLYFINEADADKLILYLQTDLPAFQISYNAWLEECQLVLQSLI